jgi:hypothetical protein
VHRQRVCTASKCERCAVPQCLPCISVPALLPCACLVCDCLPSSNLAPAYPCTYTLTLLYSRVDAIRIHADGARTCYHCTHTLTLLAVARTHWRCTHTVPVLHSHVDAVHTQWRCTHTLKPHAHSHDNAALHCTHTPTLHVHACCLHKSNESRLTRARLHASSTVLR